MLRICILDDLEHAALASADWTQVNLLASVVVMNQHVRAEADLIEMLQGFDILVVMRERTPISRNVLENLPLLKLIITTGAKNAALDIAAARERGIVVCGTRNQSMPVVELAWAFILAAARGVHGHDQLMKSGSWLPIPGSELAGKTLGLLGLGRTGAKMAKIGRSFEMEVISWSQNLSSERAQENQARLVTKEELFRQSDFLSIHLLLSDRTRALVGEEDLAKMKDTAWLINTARGQICDEQALMRAASEGRIGGVALDVFDEEPLPAAHPLRAAKNMLLTPHLGYVTTENFRLWYGDVVEDILGFCSGTPVREL
ncbi:MAG TPA: D-2-hydroxyacid dehydrogenase family protein [Candidatus Nanopelagicaceae bacterium]